MARFIDGINMERVEEIWGEKSEKGFKTKGRLVDGTMVSFGYASQERVEGANHVVQILPVTEALYLVYKDSDSFFAQKISYLAVCADGCVRGLELCEGFFEARDAGYGCEGLYTYKQLSDFNGAYESLKE